ncbi:MAG: hypothetical protein CVU41_08095 [Chloroflexi bacterium HGW-Chloroflexi-3]|nr:MAG: hypothetical protein CVU41_08095 [Chloroflexi bacterium HGW-Chloroflexi-3]
MQKQLIKLEYSSLVKKTLKIVLVFLLGGIAIYIFVGFSSLMMADDYCYFSLINNQTFINAQVETYTNAIVIAGNRFSATFFSLLASLLGPKFIQYSPMITILSLFFSLYFLFFQLLFQFMKYKDRILSAVISATFVGIILYIAPSRFQNIYWFSGVIAYTTPIITYSLLIGYWFFILRIKKPRLWQFIFLFLLSLLSAGFSETSSVTFFVNFSFLLLLGFFKNNIKFNDLKFYFPIIGLIIGMILLIISPSALLRNNGSDSMVASNITNPIPLITTSIVFGFDFVLDQIKSFTLPIMIIIIGMFSIGGFINIQNLQISIKKFLIFSTFIIVSTYLTISASMAPQLFAFGAYPNVRSQIIPTFFLLIGISVFSLSFGAIFISRHQKIKFLLIIPILLVTIYLLRASYSELTYKNELQVRKKIWEERNAYILQQVEQEKFEITVKGVDSIESIMDFNPVCFRDYYKIDIISVKD